MFHFLQNWLENSTNKKRKSIVSGSRKQTIPLIYINNLEPKNAVNCLKLFLNPLKISRYIIYVNTQLKFVNNSFLFIPEMHFHKSNPENHLFVYKDRNLYVYCTILHKIIIEKTKTVRPKIVLSKNKLNINKVLLIKYRLNKYN